MIKDLEEVEAAAKKADDETLTDEEAKAAKENFSVLNKDLVKKMDSLKVAKEGNRDLENKIQALEEEAKAATKKADEDQTADS